MMNSKFFKIITCILVVIFTTHHACPTISSDQIRDVFASVNPNDINIENFLEDLATQNLELAQVIQENSLITQSPKLDQEIEENTFIKKTTPLIIAHQINPDWLPLLFTIKSRGMSIVHDLYARVIQRVQEQKELKVVQTHAANFIQRQADRIVGSLAQILGFASQTDLDTHCNNDHFMKILLHSPIDAAGNSTLNYAVHYQDKTFQTILNMYPATKTNPEFKKFRQALK